MGFFPLLTSYKFGHINLVLGISLLALTKSLSVVTCVTFKDDHELFFYLKSRLHPFEICIGNILRNIVVLLSNSMYVDLVVIQNCSEVILSLLSNILSVYTTPKSFKGIYRQSPIFLLLTKNFYLVILCKYGNFSWYLKQPIDISVTVFPIMKWLRKLGLKVNISKNRSLSIFNRTEPNDDWIDLHFQQNHNDRKNMLHLECVNLVNQVFLFLQQRDH